MIQIQTGITNLRFHYGKNNQKEIRAKPADFFFLNNPKQNMVCGIWLHLCAVHNLYAKEFANPTFKGADMVKRTKF